MNTFTIISTIFWLISKDNVFGFNFGSTKCCTENNEHYTCTHSVYSQETNHVFCDFWYMTQTAVEDELQLCDCKINNGYHCVSWICATIQDYDFQDTNHSNADRLSKLLLANQSDIFGVHQCGYFTDDSFISSSDYHQIEQYCYKYDDFKSCYCVPQEGEENSKYCQNWICHKYVNNAKNSSSLNNDWTRLEQGFNINSSEIDMMLSSTKITHEEYECTTVYSNTNEINNHNNTVDKTVCVQWKGNATRVDETAFSAMECGTEEWNWHTSTFTQSVDGMAGKDLADTYPYKWQCRNTNFWQISHMQFIQSTLPDTNTTHVATTESITSKPYKAGCVLIAVLCLVSLVVMAAIGTGCLYKRYKSIETVNTMNAQMREMNKKETEKDREDKLKEQLMSTCAGMEAIQGDDIESNGISRTNNA